MWKSLTITCGDGSIAVKSLSLRLKGLELKSDSNVCSLKLSLDEFFPVTLLSSVKSSYSEL